MIEMKGQRSERGKARVSLPQESYYKGSIFGIDNGRSINFVLWPPEIGGNIL